MKARLLGAALTLVLAGAAQAQDLSGWYGVEGQNPDGSQYGGWATIKMTADSCEISWQIDPPTEGVCIREGDFLAVGFPNGLRLGLGIYKILSDGTMGGYWVLKGEPIGYEEITPQTPDVAIPVYPQAP